METLMIKVPGHQYPVYIGQGLLDKIKDLLSKESYSAYYIITDENVAPLYLEKLLRSLDGTVNTFCVPAGEAAKDVAYYHEIIDDMVSHALDRGCCVIALGGGVVGDLAGFVAATYLRGVPFVQIPTTLLAHDSSVGGKVGINHPQGKNLIGAFHHPSCVVYDVEFLKTLPVREWRAGFAEMIKHAFLHSSDFVGRLMYTFPDENHLKTDFLTPFLRDAVAVKAEIVGRDERESGLRKTLNLGHTLGHAIERESGYGKLNHGEAVAIGLIFAVYMSEKYFKVDLSYESVVSWFKQLGLPTTIPKELDVEQLLHRMSYDKKRVGGQIQYILLKQFGDTQITGLSNAYILNQLKAYAELES